VALGPQPVSRKCFFALKKKKKAKTVGMGYKEGEHNCYSQNRQKSACITCIEKGGARKEYHGGYSGGTHSCSTHLAVTDSMQ